MNNFDKFYVLILAGGKGRRLWPESTETTPKQFIDFFGTGRTQLQDTYLRFRHFLPPERILVSTNVAYVDMVKSQLPELPDEGILAEPLWRNTCPCAAWGAYRIYRRDEDSVMLISPADNLVVDQQAFEENIAKGIDFVRERDTLLALGVRPTRAEPGYGYLQTDQEVARGIYAVRSFTEKPERRFAEMFVESGEFLWNTSMFLSNSRHLLAVMQESLPSIFEELDGVKKDHTTEEENKYVLEHFPQYPNCSLEERIVEQARAVNVMKCDFGWADMGTWHGIYEAEVKATGDNIVLDSDVILENAHANIIKVPRGHLAVINGLNGFIVVEKGDTLLICPREDSSALIRKYSAEAEIR